MSSVALDTPAESAEQREERLAREGHDPECAAHYPGRRCDCKVSRRLLGPNAPDVVPTVISPVSMSPRVAATLAAYRDAAREVRAAQVVFQAAQTKWKQALDEFTEAIAED